MKDPAMIMYTRDQLALEVALRYSIGQDRNPQDVHDWMRLRLLIRASIDTGRPLSDWELLEHDSDLGR